MRVTVKSHLSKRGKYELYHVSVDIIDTQSNTSMLCKKWVACSWTLSFVCLVICEWFIFQKGNEKEHTSSYAWRSIAAQTKNSPKMLFWVNAGLLSLPCIGWSYQKRTLRQKKNARLYGHVYDGICCFLFPYWKMHHFEIQWQNKRSIPWKYTQTFKHVVCVHCVLMQLSWMCPFLG